jgi:hypothetical protein
MFAYVKHVLHLKTFTGKKNVFMGRDLIIITTYDLLGLATLLL